MTSCIGIEKLLLNWPHSRYQDPWPPTITSPPITWPQFWSVRLKQFWLCIDVCRRRSGLQLEYWLEVESRMAQSTRHGLELRHVRAFLNFSFLEEHFWCLEFFSKLIWRTVWSIFSGICFWLNVEKLSVLQNLNSYLRSKVDSWFRTGWKESESNLLCLGQRMGVKVNQAITGQLGYLVMY